MKGCFRYSVLPGLFLLLFAGPALAIPSLWLDISPHFSSISFAGDDLVLDGGVRIAGRRWSGWPDPVLSEVRRLHPGQRGGDCKAPETVPGQNKGQELRVLSCAPDHAWLATEAYCAEGYHDQASLYRMGRPGGEVERFPGAIPDCNSATSAVEAGGFLWVGTLKPIEKYLPREGRGVLGFDLSHPDSAPRTALDGQAITAVAADARQVWAVGHKVIARLDRSSGEWSRRYFRYFVGKGDALRLGLAGSAPPDSELSAWQYLLDYPIHDKSGFIETWRDLLDRPVAPSRIEYQPELRPWFLDALLHFGNEEDRGKGYTEKDWVFDNLASLALRVTEETDPDLHMEVVRTVQKLARQPHSLKRRETILEAMKRLNLAWRDYETDRRFEQKLQQWLNRPADRKSFGVLCAFVVGHPDYGEQLRSYLTRVRLPEGASARGCLDGEKPLFIPEGNEREKRSSGGRVRVTPGVAPGSEIKFYRDR